MMASSVASSVAFSTSIPTISSLFRSVTRRRISSSNTGNKRNATESPKLSWLDLRGSGLSAIERLCLEEVLLRYDYRNWAILGTHEPVDHRYLILENDVNDQKQRSYYNSSCVIVMGIGGKPKELLNIPKVLENDVMVCKRFSGGGTVVLDHNSLWTTFIGRTNDLPHVEAFPRPIMEWSANAVFGPAFQELKTHATSISTTTTTTTTTCHQQKSTSNSRKTLVVDSKSCGTENSGKLITIQKNRDGSTSESTTTSHHHHHQEEEYIPDFALRENDYVIGDRKMGGNAQSIVKDGWLHHTSFLWDFDSDNMEYLSLPSKRPDYRGDRSHGEFLVKLKDIYPGVPQQKFFSSVKAACETEFYGGVEITTLPEVMSIVNQNFGSLQDWFDGKCRTRIIKLEDDNS